MPLHLFTRILAVPLIVQMHCECPNYQWENKWGSLVAILSIQWIDFTKHPFNRLYFLLAHLASLLFSNPNNEFSADL